MRVYLDNCSYNRPYDEQTQPRIMLEPFDYTEWQKEYFKDISLEDFNKKAAEYDRQHPWVIGVGSDD
jgi:hypothetical protein